MSRCVSCNKLPVRPLGSFVLEDGTVVEETLCNTCKDAAFDKFSILDKEYTHGVLEQAPNWFDNT